MRRRLNVWLGLDRDDGLPFFRPLGEFSMIKNRLLIHKGITAVRGTITYDDGKPAKRKRKGGGK